jgi:O-antigen ligase
MNPSVPSRFNPSVPSVTAFEDPAVTAGGFWKAAFLLSIVGFFILYSRFFDLAANGFKIPRIVLSLVVIFLLVSGRALVSLRSVTGKFMLALLAWISLTMLTSVWKGGSLPSYYLLLQSALMFAVAAGLPLVVTNVKTFMNALAISGLIAALMSIPWGAHPFDRLALREGSYGDPNYYALALVVIVPFFWAMAALSQSFFVKIFAWLCLVPLFATIARSGSRGAMLGLGVMVLLLFLISSVQTKLLIFGGTVLGLILALAVMPDYLRTRYFTLFEVDSQAAQQLDTPAPPGNLSDLDRLHADASSALDRERLLFTSIQMTLEHPLVGVGPGNFPTAVYDESKAAGQVRNEWLVTHNSYTQLSSETGILGLILFLGLLISSVRSILYVLKRAKENGEKPDPEAYEIAKYLLLSTAALSVGIFFLAVGYEFTIYLWAGLAVSLRRTYEARQVVAEVEEEPRVVPEKRVPAPSYAKVSNPLPQRETPTVSGRPVRFNRFR